MAEVESIIRKLFFKDFLEKIIPIFWELDIRCREEALKMVIAHISHFVDTSRSITNKKNIEIAKDFVPVKRIKS